MKVKVSVLFWIKNGIAHCDKGCEYHQSKKQIRMGVLFFAGCHFQWREKIYSQKEGKEEVVGSSVMFYVTLIFLLPEHIIPSIRTN